MQWLKAFWFFAHLNRAKVVLLLRRDGVCLQEFQFPTFVTIQQEETWAQVGFAYDMMYAWGLRGGEWSRGEKVDACQEAEAGLYLEDRVADRSTTCSTAGSHCGTNCPLGCRVYKALTFIIQACTLWVWFKHCATLLRELCTYASRLKFQILHSFSFSDWKIKVHESLKKNVSESNVTKAPFTQVGISCCCLTSHLQSYKSISPALYFKVRLGCGFTFKGQTWGWSRLF